MLRPSSELHIESDLRAHDLPWVPESEPLVRDFHLPAIPDDLIEDAEFVAKAVANRRHVERGQRVHVTSREPAEPAIAEAGLFFLLQEDGQVLVELFECLLRLVPDAQVDQAVAQMRAGQELGGQIGDDLVSAPDLGYRLQRLDIAVDHAIANRKRQGHVPVIPRRMLRQLALKTTQVIEQRLSDGAGGLPCANARISQAGACVSGLRGCCFSHTLSGMAGLSLAAVVVPQPGRGRWNSSG